MGDSKKKIRKKSKKTKLKWIKTIMICAIIILAGVSSVLFRSAVSALTVSAKEAYDKSREEEKTAAYEKIYNMAYEYAENKNHVKNVATISVEQVRETAELEVLSVSDIEYVVDEDEQYWTSFDGTGVFTVNLKEAEYIIDNERNYVLVRVPSPTLGTVTCTKRDIYKPSNDNSNLFELVVSSINNGNTSEGVNYAREDLAEAQTKIKNHFQTTQRYDKSARTSAESMIQELVINFNPDVDDLTVDVEFTD